MRCVFRSTRLGYWSHVSRGICFSNAETWVVVFDVDGEGVEHGVGGQRSEVRGQG